MVVLSLCFRQIPPYLLHQFLHLSAHAVAGPREFYVEMFRNRAAGADQDLIGEQHGIFDAVRNHEHRDALLGEYLQDFFRELLRGFEIQGGERLV